MANQTCPTFSDCICAGGTPFRNFSAEAPDPASFFSLQFIQVLPDLGDFNNFWSGTAIPASCNDTASQQAADDCAVRLGTETIVDNWRGAGGTTIPLFGNNIQHCNTQCPNGSLSEFTLEAATVVARTQRQADAVAASICQYRAELNKTCPPSVETLPASNVEATTATLNAQVNPNGSVTTYFFEWGTTTSYGHFTDAIQILGDVGDTFVSADLTGLTIGTTYHFRIVASNQDGVTEGSDVTFFKQGVVDFSFTQILDLTESGVVCGIGVSFKAAFMEAVNGMATVTEISLGGPTGGCNCGNSNNQYGGSADLTPIVTHCFWDDETVPSGLRDLGFDGTIWSIAEDGFGALNNSGLVFSYLYDPNLGIFTNLGTLGGASTGIRSFLGPTHNNRHINNLHQIACTSKIAASDDHAARWDGGLIDIHPLFAPPGSLSNAVAIDATGAVAGIYINALGNNRTFINEGGGQAFSLSIGGVGTNVVECNSISKHGLYITGFANDGINDRAFIWHKPTGFAFIPLISGETFSYGLDVNSSGWTVGHSDNFVWLYRNGMTVDLLTLFPAGSGWTALDNFTNDLFINDAGQVCGFGTHNGITKAFLLTLPP